MATIDAYREFLELAQRLNFTQAAEALHITQPALSKHISALEREFDTELFKRDRRAVALTETGRALCAYATSIVDAHDEAVRAIKKIRSLRPVKLGGVLFDGNVSSIVSLATLILAQNGQPPLEISPCEDSAPVDLLLEKKVDMAISSMETEAARKLGLLRQPLIETPFVAILDRDHPLAKRSSLRMDELGGETFVRFVDTYASAAWENIASCCRRHGFEPRTRPILGSVATYTMVQPGDAVLIQQANLRQLRYLEESGAVAVVPVSDRDAFFHIDLIVREADARRLEAHLAAFATACSRILSHGREGR